MEKLQEKFIHESLLAEATCVTKPKTDKRLFLDSLVCLGDMESTADTIRRTILKASIDNKTGVHLIRKHILDKVPNMLKIGVNSRDSSVFTWKVNGIEIVVKTAQRSDRAPGVLREYFIGVKALNQLRGQLPTVMYTYGAFVCPITHTDTGFQAGSKTLYAMYEKVSGMSVRESLRTNKLTFSDWLIVFVQLLITLEIAQREVGFTHFDLHTDNVMIRDTQLSYETPIGNEVYKVNTKLSPVLIDFGHSCAQVNEQFIGSHDHPKHGMLTFMVPGCDMYKFMVSSAHSAKGKVRENILSLFRFYGTDDPYQVHAGGGFTCVTNASVEYCREVTYSPIAGCTPRQYIDWIFTTPEYQKKLSGTVSRCKRNIYIPLQFPEKSTSDRIDKALHIIQTGLLSQKASYIVTMYHINVLNTYVKLKNLKNLASQLTHYRKWAHTFIEKDRQMLNNVFLLKVPSKVPTNITKVPIMSTSEQKKVDIESLAKYTVQLKPYLQFYYTILELDLNEFSDWVNAFEECQQYKFYEENSVVLEQVLRWADVLKASTR